jgi:hypothetical protein
MMQGQLLALRAETNAESELPFAIVRRIRKDGRVSPNGFIFLLSLKDRSEGQNKHSSRHFKFQEFLAENKYFFDRISAAGVY